MPEENNEEINTGGEINDEMDGDEINEETTGQTSAEQIGKFSSPEAIIIFLIAVIFDLIGLILFVLSFFGIGIPFSFILDIIGLIIIGGWMLIRKGHITTTRSAGKLIEKSGKKLSKRLGITFLGELIPFFGDIAPCWTLAVFFELKNN